MYLFSTLFVFLHLLLNRDSKTTAPFAENTIHFTNPNTFTNFSSESSDNKEFGKPVFAHL